MTSRIELGNRAFIIDWRRAPGFITDVDTTTAWITACGALFALLIAMIISSLQLLGERADEIAKEKTSLLREREASLKATTRRLETLIAASPIAIMAVDTKDRLIIWNPACEKIFGWTAEEVLGKWLPFVAKAKIQESKDLIGKVRVSQQPVFFEGERYRKDGAPVWTSTALMPLFDEHGNFEGVLATITNKSEELAAHKALELQRASAIQNSRLAALGEMASGIAHEINNPLAIIAAHSNILLMKIEKDGKVEPEKLVVSLKKIEEVSFRIARIIKGLRNFARLSEGEPDEIKPIDAIVGDTLEICRERFKNNEIDLIVAVEPGLSIKCQSVQISQVLLNLLNNAFDAAVVTSNPWVKIEAFRSGVKVKIAIVDSGLGIPENIVDRIAEPFFTTKPVGQGTGLGLSISKGIVEQHGGTFSVDRSATNTRIVVELPLYEESQT
ncbi:MAG: ATP-binding protein, partial [Bdellovibrionota bacterium]